MRPVNLWVLLLLLPCFAVPRVSAEEEMKYREVSKDEREQMRPAVMTGKVIEESGIKRTVQVEGGLRFHVVPDWPIEKSGGFIGPVELDSYVHQKIEKAEGHFDAKAVAVDTRIAKLEKELYELESVAALKSRKV